MLDHFEPLVDDVAGDDDELDVFIQLARSFRKFQAACRIVLATPKTEIRELDELE
ncbi:MAG: hypothetical protein HY801_12335 [Candidatus Lindowbacteria bacterium]|nr:hypothetical protein [Candidatus Lindowbacteria bacterium]